MFGLLTPGTAGRVLPPRGLSARPRRAFIIECIVSGLARFDRRQRVQTLDVAEDVVTCELSRHDAARQRATTQVVTLDGHGMRMRPVVIRYLWPSELGPMAFRPAFGSPNVYSGWNRRPFGSASGGPRLSLQPA